MSAALADPGAHPATDTSELGSRVRKGALWNGLGTLVLKLVSIGVTAVVARLASPAEFGTFAVALAVYTVVAGMSDFGVLSVLHRGDIDLDELAPTATTITVVSCGFFAAGLTVAAPALADAFSTPDAVAAIRVIALVVVLYGLFAVPIATLTRDFRQDQVFLANMIGFVPANALLIVLALAGEGALAFAWSRVLGQLVVGIAATVFATRRYRCRVARRPLRYLLAVGTPLAGANLVAFVLLNVDYLFVGHAFGPKQLGIYLLAFNVSTLTTALLSSMLNSVALPAFSRVRHDPVRLAGAVVRANKLVALLAWPLAAVLVATAHPLVDVVYGPRWGQAAAVIALLAPCGALLVHETLYSNLLVGGAGHTRALLAIQLLWLALLVPAMWFAVEHGGTTAVAGAHLLVVGGVLLPVYLRTTRRLCGIPAGPSLRAVAPIVLAAAVAGAAAAGVVAVAPGDLTRLVLGGVTGGVVYLLLTAPSLREMLGDDRPWAVLRPAVALLDGLIRVRRAVLPRRQSVAAS